MWSLTLCHKYFDCLLSMIVAFSIISFSFIWQYDMYSLDNVANYQVKSKVSWTLETEVKPVPPCWRKVKERKKIRAHVCEQMLVILGDDITEIRWDQHTTLGIARSHKCTCANRKPWLTLRNASSDPFSMYSVIIITGLPSERKREAGNERQIIVKVNDAHHSLSHTVWVGWWWWGGGLEGMSVCLCEQVSVGPSISVP